jgi:hypothetical protein
MIKMKRSITKALICSSCAISAEADEAIYDRVERVDYGEVALMRISADGDVAILMIVDEAHEQIDCWSAS